MKKETIIKILSKCLITYNGILQIIKEITA